ERKLMPKKRQPTIVDIVDDLVNASAPLSNGHDAERMAVAEESGELDEMLEPPPPRRKKASKAQAESDEPVEKPARRRRAPRDNDGDQDDTNEQLRLPLVPLR